MSIILVVLNLILIHSVDGNRVHYILPSSATHDQCPTGESCTNLATLAGSIDRFLDSNTILTFPAGNHTLDTKLIVSNIIQLSLNGSFTATIVCRGSGRLEFINITQMQIIELRFTGCSSKVELVQQFTSKDSSFIGSDDSSGSALLLNYTSDARITGNSFINTVGNYPTQVRYLIFHDLYLETFSARVGGALIVTSSRVSISNSHFINNSAQVGGAIFSEEKSNLTISNCTFINNRATLGSRSRYYQHGGALFIGSSCTVTANISSFVNNTAGTYGGAIALIRATFFDTQNVFQGNKAGEWGGAISVYGGSKIAIDSSYYSNNTAYGYGGVMHAFFTSIITVGSSCFDSNVAGYGGVIDALSTSIITVGNSSFDSNVAGYYGGVIIMYESGLILTSSSFVNNTAGNNGGVLYGSGGIYLSSNNITVGNSSFDNNVAGDDGGVIYALSISITVGNSSFDNNVAGDDGGVIYALSISITVGNSSFDNNVAGSDGGVMYASSSSSITVDNSSFDNNTAGSDGGVIYINKASCSDLGSVHSNNIATSNGEVITVNESDLILTSSSFVNNTAGNSGGALYNAPVSVNNVLLAKCDFYKNRASNGGAITLFNNSLTVIEGEFAHNKADRGGAIYLLAGISLMVNCSSFSHNSASCMGGAIYSDSNNNLTINSSMLNNNKAERHGGLLCSYNTVTVNKPISGGAIHLAQSQLIFCGANTMTVGNQAEYGGAVYASESKLLIETDSQVYIDINSAKHNGGGLYLTMSELQVTGKGTYITGNIACNKGGGIYATNSSIAVDGALHLIDNEADNGGGVSVGRSTKLYGTSDKNDSIEFISNRANRYGGAMHVESECNCNAGILTVVSEKEYFSKSVLFSFYNNSANVFGINLSARFLDRCAVQTDYDMETNKSSEINVQCSNTISVVTNIICSCPIGFQLLNNNEITCDCVCIQQLQTFHKTLCNLTTQSIIRKDNFWIAYINHSSSGYLIYPQCPFDYCHPPDEGVSINLNLPNGSDAQCDFNRMGTLCGTCKPGLSVSFTSSNCLPCPISWPTLLISIIILSGIGLVAFIAVLNLTVAVGTLNAIIFYANILAANKNTLFPSRVSFASVIISWLNLDIGFDICLIDGMDTYIKAWLQLAFPVYIIILGVINIKCKLFGRLARKRDPLATLATVILLSYAKLLQTIILTFSHAVLVYPDGSRKYVWLPDASVAYFSSKHAVLFFIATLVLFAGLIYTALLLAWQWLNCCPKRRLKWIGGQKLGKFLETYHAPYVPKHRYWAGLLLLIRVSVYLISSFNPSGDSRVVLLFSVFAVSSLIVYMAAFGVKIYKLQFINAMETFTYFNIISVCVLTWYTLDVGLNQAAVVNVSAGIIIAQISMILLYHTVERTNKKLFSRIQEAEICKKFVIKRKLEQDNNNELLLEVRPEPEPVDSIYCEVETSLHERDPTPSLEAMKQKANSKKQMNDQEGDYCEVVVEEIKQRPNVNLYSGIKSAKCDDSAEPKLETQ